jgi:hypothetical protein
MIAIRTRRKLAEFIVPLAVFVAIVAVLALFIPGKAGSFVESFVHWLWSIPALLGMWLLLEYVGAKVTSLPFWQRVSAVTRVALLVGLIVAVVLLVLAVSHYLRSVT